ncbi:MAG TPA: hypothetical protein VHB21_03370, partial [Minicystis sp.]|nr:hypothetical protein [Minicystis sp.]
MARRWPVLAGVPCAVAATLASAPARAFTIDGHDAIEAAAYRRLAAAHAVDDGRGGTVPGRAALAFLIRRGFLARPRCFEPAPADAAACAKDAKDEPLAFWPELLSGSADLVSARQFSTNGQCFHFMAPTEYAWTTPRDARLGVPRGFATEAYWRCTRALSELFFESLRDPSRANHENRGLYAVMHGVADSFSAAHVERDRAWRILYLKPWRARAFLSYLPPGHWAGLHYVGGPSHHGIVDGRDDEFVRQDDAACREYKHAYALPEGCLTERGDRAARA